MSLMFSNCSVALVKLLLMIHMRQVPELNLSTPIGKMFMPLEGLVDIEAEKIRINKEIDKTDKDLKQVLEKLSNSNFTERAPAEIVQENIDRKDSLDKS